MRLLFNDKHRHHAENTLKKLLAIMTPAGIPMVLQTSVLIRHLSYLANPNLGDNDVLIVLRQMNQQKKTKLADFEKRYEKHLSRQRAHQAKQTRTWTFIIPINLSLPVKRNLKVVILGVEFMFMEWSKACRLLGKRARPKVEKFLTRRQISLGKMPPVCVVVHARGPNHLIAWSDTVERAFDVLRGSFEISNAFSKVNIHFGRQRRRAKIPMPPFALAYSPSRPLNLITFLAGVDFDGAPFKVAAAGLKSARAWIASLHRPFSETSILAIVVDALRLYSQAFDAEADYQCFLGFWQLAETLTLASAYQGDGKVVARRLSWFGYYFVLDPNALNHIFLGIFSKRNDIVHAGQQVADETDINVLKLCCESAINWIIAHRKILPTRQHLEEFYRVIQKSDSDLISSATAIRFVRSFNTKCTPQLLAALNRPIVSPATWSATAGYERKRKASAPAQNLPPTVPSSSSLAASPAVDSSQVTSMPITEKDDEAN